LATVVLKPSRTKLTITWSSRNTASLRTSPQRARTVTIRLKELIESQHVTVMGWADDERFGDGGHMRPVLSIGGISVVITLQDS
jgi:hypothetical protein